MQLSLFDDNRQQIMLNCVDDCLKQLDLDKAASIIADLLDEYPSDPQVSFLNQTVSEWGPIILDPDIDWQCPAHLHRLWERSINITHKPLKKALQTYIADALLPLPDPHRHYFPPHFHIGSILLELRRFDEAAYYLQAAMGHPDIPQGRLLTWYANALHGLKDIDGAMNWLMLASLLDPSNIPFEEIVTKQFINLLASLRFDADDDMEEHEEISWLPAWGLIQRAFTLPLPQETMEFLLNGMSLNELAMDDSMPGQKSCFFLIMLAEQQRKSGLDATKARRAIKEISPFIFKNYMDRMVSQ